MKNRQGLTQVDMATSVREALEALQPVPAPDPDTWSANRAAFLDEAHTYAQEAVAAPLASSLPAAALVPWRVRVREFAALVRGTLLHNGSPVAMALRATLVIALVLAGSVGTVTAARDSLPGSPFYPMKVWLETWDIDHARTPDDIARTALAQSNIRVSEAARLRNRGDPVPEEAVIRYQQQLELALSAAGDLEEPVRQQTHAEISESVHQQLQFLEHTSAQVHGDAVSDDAVVSDPGIQAMIQTMRAAQARLGQPGDQRPGQAGPPEPGYGPADPVTDGDVDDPDVSEPSTTNDQDAPSGGPGPGPGGNGEGAAGNGPVNDMPGEGMPDGETPPATDVGDSNDVSTPGSGPSQGQNDDTGGSAPGPGSGSDDGDDDAGGPGFDNRGGNGGNGNSDNGSQSERGGTGKSGRS